eukprot:137081-Rhodomonas_salina.1
MMMMMMMMMMVVRVSRMITERVPLPCIHTRLHLPAPSPSSRQIPVLQRCQGGRPSNTVYTNLVLGVS